MRFHTDITASSLALVSHLFSCQKSVLQSPGRQRVESFHHSSSRDQSEEHTARALAAIVSKFQIEKQGKTLPDMVGNNVSTSNKYKHSRSARQGRCNPAILFHFLWIQFKVLMSEVSFRSTFTKKRFPALKKKKAAPTFDGRPMLYFSAEAPLIKKKTFIEAFTSSVFLIEVSFVSSICFYRSLLPLQVGGVGLWVHVFLQVVTEVHQHLVIHPSAAQETKGKNVQSIQLTLILSHTYYYYTQRDC